MRRSVLILIAVVLLIALTGCSRGTPLFYDDFADDPAAYEFERVRIDGSVEDVEEHADGGVDLLVFAVGDPDRPIHVSAAPEIWGAAPKGELITIDGMLTGTTTAFGDGDPIPSMEASSFGISFGPRDR